MVKQKKGEGFHSAAGLIRYFDAEEKTALKINRKLVIVMCIAAVIVVTTVKFLYPISG